MPNAMGKRDIYSKSPFVSGLDYANIAFDGPSTIVYFKGLLDLSQLLLFTKKE
jgi:hypothetical protein